MKKILFSIIILTVFACSKPNSGEQIPTCSIEKPDGTCEKGKVCKEGVCEPIGEACSDTALNGFCEGEQICVNGICKDKEDFNCSHENPNGKCEDGNSCLNGSCIKNANLCSSENKVGKCSNGQTCLDGICKSNTELCSISNKQGLCLSEQTCLDGICKSNTELCSTNNPTGLCSNDRICLNGECSEKKCDEGDISKCYPSNQSQVGKGICQQGIKVCKEGVWGECKNAILPKEEICDGIDNDCDGNIDDGVLNACGTCGEVPTEIANNHIDDDCDGLVDENNDGVENCDGRVHQPCYTGNPATHGKGICHGGFRDCNCENGNDGQTCINGEWGECIGQVLPQVEICGNNIDDDCDGYTDEFCNPTECVKTSNNDVCGNHKDDDCNGLIDDGCGVNPRECEDGAVEICGNGIDDDCTNGVDDGCACIDGTSKKCFTGDPTLKRDLENTTCKSGTMTCFGGELWGECTGEVLPQIELCDGIDNDCDGIIDNNAVDGNICGECSDNIPLEICGDGIDNDCDTFIDEDCPDNCIAEPEICDGIDNNCDGLIDEGVLNACGTCDESCYTDTTTDEDLNNGTYDGVDRDDNGNITLNTRRVENNFIWIANSGHNQVRKLNTITGETFGPFNVCANPSRTAVTRDGGVWIACRNDNKITKLNPDGTLVPGFPVTLVAGCGPRGLAIDKDGNGWAGCHGNGKVYKILPNGNIANGFPVETGSKTYGLAIDSKGILWNSPRASNKNFRLDTGKSPGDAGFVTNHDRGGNPYGITIDHNDDIWYANYGGSNNKKLTRLHYNPNTSAVEIQLFDAAHGGGRGLAVDNRGHLWVAYNNDGGGVCEYQSDGTLIHCYSIGNTPVGVGIDSEEDVWVVTYYGGAKEFKFDPANPNAIERTNIVSHSLGTGLVYTYSDMTGYNLRNITAPSGKFTVIQDVVRIDATFDSLKLDGDTPNGSKMKVRARVSNDKINWSAWSVSVDFVNSDSDMILDWGNNKPAGRYIQLEVSLELGNDGAKPKFRSIAVNWQRP